MGADDRRSRHAHHQDHHRRGRSCRAAITSSSASSSREPVQARIGKSACDQCRYCTEFCPRFLLGYAVEPHQVMRSLAFTATGAEYWNQMGRALLLLRPLHALRLPRGTFPKEACDDVQGRDARREHQVDRPGADVKPHPMHDGRRVPIKIADAETATSEHTTVPRRGRTSTVDTARGSSCRSNKAPARRTQPLVKKGDASRPASRSARSPTRPSARSSTRPSPRTVAEVTEQPHHPDEASMNEKSIGLIELSSIAAGFEVADTMLKAGNVRS